MLCARIKGRVKKHKKKPYEIRTVEKTGYYLLSILVRVSRYITHRTRQIEGRNRTGRPFVLAEISDGPLLFYGIIIAGFYTRPARRGASPPLVDFYLFIFIIISNNWFIDRWRAAREQCTGKNSRLAIKAHYMYGSRNVWVSRLYLFEIELR